MSGLWRDCPVLQVPEQDSELTEKRQAQRYIFAIPVQGLGARRDKQIPGAPWPDNLTQSAAPGSQWESLSQQTR